MRAFLFAATALAALTAGPASAQQLDARVGKLEAEMRAVQRKVFPGGAGQLILPEVEQQRAPETAPGVPATAPIADLSARVTSLERQVAELTGQVEQTGFRVRQLDEAFQAYKRATDARIAALEGGAAAPASGPAPLGAEPAPEPSRTSSRPPASRPAPASTSADPDRAARIAAVPQQDTGDAGEDAYMYGYRLWAAKLYPEAQAQLKKVVATYPRHRRASFAQNLLGRAYLDEGKPSLASMAFYDNYKKMPEGERAPDSLYYLAQALMVLKKPADACKVYGELTDVYAAKIDARMKADIAKGRAAAKCGA